MNFIQETLIATSGFHEIWINQGHEIDHKWLKDVIKQRLSDQFSM